MSTDRGYSTKRLANGRCLATFDGETKEFASPEAAYKWASNKWKRQTIRSMIGEPFLEWEQIAEVVGVSKVRAEQIGLAALIKIREALMGEVGLVSELEDAGIYTEDARC